MNIHNMSALRFRFKQHLLQEIIFDLMICEIEGWDKRKYINEIKELINGINAN